MAGEYTASACLGYARSVRTRAGVQQVSAAFAARFGGEVRDVRSHGTGHIHDTFALRWQDRELLVQRFNTDVFENPDAVMRNIIRVTEHLRAKLQANGARDVARRVLRVQPAPDGALYFEAGGQTYRAFDFISDTAAFDVVQKPEQPYEAGRAFGGFVADLVDLPEPALIETIPQFHDTPSRLEAFRAAVRSDALGRASLLQALVASMEARAELAHYCVRLHARGDLPRVCTHNDAKLSNLLFDAVSGEALCVVDLDTVMPGFAAYDFGDLVRTTACPIAEDAPDPAAVEVRMDYVEALARGYLAAGPPPSAAELEALAIGPSLFCYELGIRFLTDHILGDVYFPIERPAHNLERARVQLALSAALSQRTAAIHDCLKSAAAAG